MYTLIKKSNDDIKTAKMIRAARAVIIQIKKQEHFNALEYIGIESD